jgi:hypothetical protein
LRVSNWATTGHSRRQGNLAEIDDQSGHLKELTAQVEGRESVAATAKLRR